MSERDLNEPSLFVLAGTNGAGKSSVAGAEFRRRGANYFNPDEATSRIRAANPRLSESDANSLAWQHGRRLLETAILTRASFAFETTLGGRTIPRLLHEAPSAGLAVRIWYVGLEGVELHLARVRARVAAGGHAIPDARVRERYDRSRENLIRLLPVLAELRLFDNSADADPASGEQPTPLLLLHLRDGAIVEHCPLADVPRWAKPVFAAAVSRFGLP